jgi:hypothetical protein
MLKHSLIAVQRSRFSLQLARWRRSTTGRRRPSSRRSRRTASMTRSRTRERRRAQRKRPGEAGGGHRLAQLLRRCAPAADDRDRAEEQPRSACVHAEYGSRRARSTRSRVPTVAHAQTRWVADEVAHAEGSVVLRADHLEPVFGRRECVLGNRLLRADPSLKDQALEQYLAHGANAQGGGNLAGVASGRSVSDRAVG